jgi:hypothetical protein
MPHGRARGRGKRRVERGATACRFAALEIAAARGSSCRTSLALVGTARAALGACNVVGLFPRGGHLSFRPSSGCLLFAPHQCTHLVGPDPCIRHDHEGAPLRANGSGRIFRTSSSVAISSTVFSGCLSGGSPVGIERRSPPCTANWSVERSTIMTLLSVLLAAACSSEHAFCELENDEVVVIQRGSSEDDRVAGAEGFREPIRARAAPKSPISNRAIAAWPGGSFRACARWGGASTAMANRCLTRCASGTQ